MDVAKLQKLVKDQGFLIDGGYGKIKGTTFRISNMGDETEATHDTSFSPRWTRRWRSFDFGCGWVTGNPFEADCRFFFSTTAIRAK